MAVVVETLLLRVLARAGIYMFQAGTPAWLTTLYRSLVFTGNVGLHFATLLVALLLASLAYTLWQRAGVLHRSLALLGLAVLGLSGAFLVTTPAPTWSLLYLALSAALVGLAVAVFWANSGTRLACLAVLSLALSWGSAYAAKALPPLQHLGVSFPSAAPWLTVLGEALAGLGILLAFLGAVRMRPSTPRQARDAAADRKTTAACPEQSRGDRRPRTADRRLAVARCSAAAIPVLPLLALYAFKPQMLPLIAIWAFGLGLYLPFPLYALGLWLLILTVWRLADDGRWPVGAGWLLVLLSHRMLPLVYFNLLVVVGFLLVGRVLDR